MYWKNFLIALLAIAGVYHLAWSQPLPPPGSYTHTAVADGSWSNPATWNTGTIPGNNAIVRVPTGRLVIVNRRETARIKFLQIEGEFRLTIHQNTRLLVETIQVAAGGFFKIGDPVNTVKPDKLAEVVFINDGQAIDRTWDPSEKSRGMISFGKIHVYGHPVTPMAEMDLSVRAGATILDLRNPVPADWLPGDSIVFAGAHFRRNTPFQDERLTIASTTPTTIKVTSPLQYGHFRTSVDMNLHIANLRRNVVFRSESTAIPLRGHLMMVNNDVDIQHASFVEMGRTDKSIPLDEVLVDINTGVVTPNPNIQNRRGRYAVHFHINGIQPSLSTPPSRVKGCVVIGTPGWGFVNHSSHVAFEDNICWKFVGSAFVTEAGDELGNFDRNIAIHGIGNGEYLPIRLVFENDDRPQPLSDFGFNGEGFWFQGSTIRARDNVANSCNGAGMIWFSTGAVDIATNQYVGFPRSAVSGAYAGYPSLSSLEARNWQYDSDALVISDLPILECDGFDAYGCLVGFRLRFCNFNNIAFYNEDPFDYDLQIQPLPGKPVNYADRLRQSVNNLRLWNNEQGFRVRYNEKTDWNDVTNMTRISFFPTKPLAGAEFHHQTQQTTFNNVLIDGYAIAGWAVSNKNDNNNNLTFTQTTYANYANDDRQILDSTCANLSGVSATNLTTSSATIVWNTHPNNAVRFLFRFREVGAVKWQFSTATGVGTTAKVLSNLSKGTTYEYQAIAGCTDRVSWWTPIYQFTTPTMKQGVANAPEASPDLRVYPNPVGDNWLRLELGAGQAVSEVEVLDLQGRVILRPDPAEALTRGIQVEALPAGVYLLRVATLEGPQSVRFVRQ